MTTVGATIGSRHRPWGDVSVESQPQPVSAALPAAEQRLSTGFAELDRVLGGGIVPGSLLLIGGDPGIGKSTLLLQVLEHVSRSAGRCLYVTGEESVRQVQMRARRLGTLNSNLYIAAETDIERIESFVGELSPVALVVDSIQTVFHGELASPPGSISQVRECAAHLLRLAKTRGVAVLTIGHVTKSGDLAGPRALEHATDAVLYFEGERHYAYRLIRAVKNRFGATSELGLFEMTATGLREVPNPSAVFLAERPAGSSGSVVVASIEGSRPLLVEIQALLATSPFGQPRRTVIGLDPGRVALILAVLERRLGMRVGGQDVYLKVSGGVRVDEPAADLGIAAAIASSFRDRPAAPRVAVIGEVGLAGEVRAVSRVEERLREAARLGFEACVLPAGNRRGLSEAAELGIELIAVDRVGAALEVVLA